MARVLFIHCPDVTLHQPKVYQELCWGASLVAGSLEHAGMEVDYFDFNVALARIRDRRFLNEWEKRVLTQGEALDQELRSPGDAPSLREWVRALCDKIPADSRFDCIALSMSIKAYEAYSSRAILHFAILLLEQLRKRFPVPVFAGGKDIMNDLGKNYISGLFTKLPVNPIQTFFTKNGHSVFATFLEQYFRGEGPLIEKPQFVDENSAFKHSNILPKYDIKNRADLYVGAAQLFPEEFLKKYPALQNQSPLTLVPFRHSMGCPYRCNFCSSGGEAMLRIHEVEDVVHKLTLLKEKGFSNFRWFNDNLNLGPVFPDQLADKLIEADLGIFFSDSANVRHTSLPLFTKLRKAGCVKLWFGSETMNDKLLKLINKGTTFDDLTRTLGYAQATGIWSGLNIIYGFPHEGAAEFYDTLNFLRDRTDLYDCFDVNIFRLLKDTAYDRSPELHRIKKVFATDNGRVFAFDEIGGVTWAQREIDVGWKRKMLETTVANSFRLFMTNDYYLFTLLRAGFDKPGARAVMQEVYDFHRHHGTLHFLAEDVDRHVPENRKIDLGANIEGRIFNVKLAEAGA